MKYLFPFFHFYPLCIFWLNVSLLQASLGRIMVVVFFHSYNICKLIGKFNLFIFKVITNNGVIVSAIYYCYIFLFFNFSNIAFFWSLKIFFQCTILITSSFPLLYILWVIFLVVTMKITVHILTLLQLILNWYQSIFNRIH